MRLPDTERALRGLGGVDASGRLRVSEWNGQE
jgi:hypothetical protein